AQGQAYAHGRPGLLLVGGMDQQGVEAFDALGQVGRSGSLGAVRGAGGIGGRHRAAARVSRVKSSLYMGVLRRDSGSVPSRPAKARYGLMEDPLGWVLARRQSSPFSIQTSWISSAKSISFSRFIIRRV